jgi:hypothetical protein
VRLPELNEHQLTLLAETYQGFVDSGKWPTMSYVDVVLDRDHGIAIEPILYEIPEGLLRHGPNFMTDQSTIELTAAGLYFVPAARPDLDRFIQLVRACAERERNSHPSPAEVARSDFSNTDAETVWQGQISKAEAARAFEIFKMENLYSGLAGSGCDDRWTITVDRNIRRYRDVATIEDYLARRPEPPSRTWAPPAPVEPYVFILMPFGEQWSNNVSDAIGQACSKVGSNFAGLRAERADAITQPGRITDQIISAIERADVLVADISGSNPNVLFELGYGDALNKPIIVLNQEVDKTPFDIKDWRQIIYSAEDLTQLRETLILFLTGSLLTLGFNRTSPLEDD